MQKLTHCEDCLAVYLPEQIECPYCGREDIKNVEATEDMARTSTGTTDNGVSVCNPVRPRVFYTQTKK